MERLLSAIFQKIEKDPHCYQAYEDLLAICHMTKKTDVQLARKYLEKLSDELEKLIPTITDIGNMRKMFALHREVVFAGARDSFHLCLLAVEWNRDPEKKFYVPRMGVLREVVEARQDLEDGKLDLAAISLPPGAGKTTLAIFYLTWIAGRHPEEPSLTGSHSNSFVRGVYDECLRIFDPNGEYLWSEVFPETQVVIPMRRIAALTLESGKDLKHWSSHLSAPVMPVYTERCIFCTAMTL